MNSKSTQGRSMSLALSLATLFGKPAAERLIQALGTRKDGSKRLEQAATALASGDTAIEALKQAFGKGFLATVNEVLGSSKAAFTYEAGTARCDHTGASQGKTG